MKAISLSELIKENIFLANEKIVTDEIVDDITTMIEEIPSANIDKCVKDSTTIVRKIFYHYDDLSKLIFEIGLKLDDEEKFEEAIFYYKFSIMLQPNPKAYNNLAVIFASLDQMDDASNTLNEGSLIFPNDANIIENLELLKS
jgi:tetratricopeptide (TPR) repeat protein